MADDPKKKASKPKDNKAAAQHADPKAEARAAAKKEKAKAAKAAEAAAPPPPPVEKPAPPPRKPADPRVRAFKKLKGKFLPKGPLRDQHRALLARWNADDNHGDVTVEEVKGLVTDWKAARSKPDKATV
jgi:hypothetical protein